MDYGRQLRWFHTQEEGQESFQAVKKWTWVAAQEKGVMDEDEKLHELAVGALGIAGQLEAGVPFDENTARRCAELEERAAEIMGDEVEPFEFVETSEDALRELTFIHDRLIAATGISPRTVHRLTSTGTMLYVVGE